MSVLCVSRVSKRICILRLVKRIFVDTSVLLRCYFAFDLLIVEYCSLVWGSSEGHLQLLERLLYLVARLLVCCTRLIRTLFTVCSASFHLLLLEFDIPELWPQLIQLSFKYQGVERPNNRYFLLAQVRLWNDLPYTVFDTGTLDWFKSAVNCWLLP